MAVAADSAVGRVEALLERADPAALELAGALLELYGEGLGRLLSYDDGTLVRAAAADELVAHLLLLHDLHPVPVEDRVQAALDEVRPYLESHGGSVELVRVEDGVATLRMEGSCKGCPSSTLTLKHAIESAVFKAAPDVSSIEPEDAPAPLLQIEVRGPAPTWTSANGIALGGEGPLIKEVGGAPVLFVRAGGTQYAYRPQCPACGASLARATLDQGRLACTSCDQRYDVRGAGRCLTTPGLHLTPVPLLADATGAVTVAV